MVVPKIKVDPGLPSISLRFPISEIAKRSSGAKLYTGLSGYYYIKKWEQSDIGGAYCCMKPINLFDKYTVHYKIDFCVSDSVDFE